MRSMSSLRPFAMLVLGSLALTVPAQAQTLYGNDGSSQTLWEFTWLPGGACSAPNVKRIGCPYTQGMCGIVTGTVPAPPLGILGDVAVDSSTDSVFVTDGKIVERFVGDRPCGSPSPCTPIDAFPIPPSFLLGPITGLGYDELGTLTPGTPTLWVTDGRLIAGLGPPPIASCLLPTLLIGPCLAPLPPGVFATDITWDPLSGTVWVSDTAGSVSNILVTTAGCTLLSSFPVATCGLGPVLQGIAFDLGSGRLNSGSPVPALFVTDGFAVEHVDITGAVPGASFYAVGPCSPTNGPLNGLAFASHGIDFGAPKIISTCGSFGQSTTPSATFGLEFSNAPPFGLGVLLMNFSVPGPGVACPPITGSGASFWVNPAFGAPAFFFFPPTPPGCNAFLSPIAPAVPTGIEVYYQFFFVNGATVTDHTQGCAVTITPP
jgi:hypothetical protein